MELTYDPGHVKKSFQKSLIKLFGTKKVYKLFPSRIAQWFMRSLCEAKALFPNNRSAIQDEFRRRMNFLLSHYTKPTCEAGCPCQNIKHSVIPVNFVCDHPLMPAMPQYFARVQSSKKLAKFRLVCRHWNLLITDHLDNLEKQKHKTILPTEDPNIPQLTELVCVVFDVRCLLLADC